MNREAALLEKKMPSAVSKGTKQNPIQVRKRGGLI